MIEEMGGDFLQWLRGFYYVAKRRSVTQAAVEMGRNQPTVSHQIKCLEEAFGVRLFDRSSGRMELTAEGRLFLDKTISLFEIVKEMKSEINGTVLEQAGKVVIVASHAIVHSFLPAYIRDFRQTHPNVFLDVEGGPLEMVLGKVESAEADFGIVNVDSIPAGLTYYELFKTTPALIAPKKNPFFKGKEPSVKEIAMAPFIFFTAASNMSRFIQDRFREHDLKPKVVLVLNNYASVKKYVSLGVGVSIMDHYALTEEDHEVLDIFPMEQFFKQRSYGLVLRKQKYLAPQVKAFIRSIKSDIPLG